MAYFNNFNNTNFCSTSSASRELDMYPFLSQQASATEEVDSQAFSTLANRWGMVGRPGPVVESVSPPTSYVTQTNGHGQPSYSGHYWPAVGQQAQSHNPGFLSRDASFINSVASETSTVVPIPSSVPLDHWGADWSGPSASTFYAENVQPSYPPSTGPTRSGLVPTGRFQPYGMSYARVNERRDAEAGPSTLVPPPVPYVGPPTPQPSGGISETTADAETTQTITEEDMAPTTKRTRRPHGQGKPRCHRGRSQKDAHRLCEWVQRRMKLPEAPDINGALAVAVDIIPTIRPLANLEPCLLTGQGKRTAAGSKKADDEFERRNVERRLFKKLSRYYPLGQGQSVWERPKLLLLVLKDLEDLPALPGPSNESPP